MEGLTWVEYVAVVASVVTLMSASFNVLQWRTNRRLETDLRARLQSSFNSYYAVAEWADRIRCLGKNPFMGDLEFSSDPTDRLNVAVACAHALNGIADAARIEITAYTREHFGIVPRHEHPMDPQNLGLPSADPIALRHMKNVVRQWLRMGSGSTM
jgi:hypothetical protein